MSHLLDGERLGNPFLLALRPGRCLHSVVLHAGNFDAVLVPSTAVLTEHHLVPLLCHSGFSSSLEDGSATHSDAAVTASSGTVSSLGALRSTSPLSWFALCHLIRFDNNGLSSEFTTLSGHRGAFSESLDTVGRSGLLGRVRILGHLDPAPAQPFESHRTYDAQTLNIFILDGVMVEPGVITEARHMFEALEAKEKQKQQPTPSSIKEKSAMAAAASGTAASISRLLGSVVTSPSSWVAGTSSAGVAAAPASGASAGSQVPKQPVKRPLTEQELAIQYPEFQRLMLLPESSSAAKALHAFVDHLLLHSSTSAQAQQSNAAVLQAKEVRGFIQQTVTQVMKLACWKGKESVAREGMEKYICSKAYSKVFATSWAEKQRDATLKRKLSLLCPVIGPAHLDGLDGVQDAPEFQSAVQSLRQMNEYRSPRDKLECASAACSNVLKCIAHVRRRCSSATIPTVGSSSHVGHAEDSPPCAASSPTSSSKNASMCAFPSGGINLGGADDFLPSLMLCVLHANVDNLCSNLTYIDLYRDKSLLELSGEYNLTSLQSCAEFWLTCQAGHLRMTEDEFDSALGNVFAKPSSLLRQQTPASSPSNDLPQSSTTMSLVDELFATPEFPSPRTGAPAGGSVATEGTPSAAVVSAARRVTSLVPDTCHALLKGDAVVFDDLSVAQLRQVFEAARHLYTVYTAVLPSVSSQL